MTRVADLTGAELAFWVARSEGLEDPVIYVCGGKEICQCYVHDAKFCNDRIEDFKPHEDWAQGGRLIEKHRISIKQGEGCYAYFDHLDATASGPTPLIAAMRALVASKFGETVTDQEAPCAK